MSSSSDSRSPVQGRRSTAGPSLATVVTGSRVIIAQFAEDTTIHGIRDLFVVWNQNGVQKWTWIFLLIASTGVMVYEMIQVILNYLARPTATQIVQLHPDAYRYPLMLFCPQSWINATRVKALGMPKSVLAYSLSFFHLINMQLNPPIVDFESTAKQLHEIMAKYQFNTYFDLYLNISDDSDRTMTCPSCAVWPLQKRVTETGVCYVVELKPAKRTIVIEDPPQITYNTVYPSGLDAENWVPTHNNSHNSEQFYVGYYPNDFFGLDAIKLGHNRSYVVKVTPTLQRRFGGLQPTTGRACYDNDTMTQMNHSQRMCYSDCEEWTYGPACWNCQYLGYSFDRPDETRPPWFSSLTYVSPPDVEQCMEREKPSYDLCSANCLPPCEEWVYDTTVIIVNSRRMWTERDEADVTIVISYQVKGGTLAVEEIATYTYHTFLSNIGGQMGLWLGASILSVFQLALFLVRLAYNRWKNEHMQTNVQDLAYDNPVGVTENGRHWTARF